MKNFILLAPFLFMEFDGFYGLQVFRRCGYDQKMVAYFDGENLEIFDKEWSVCPGKDNKDCIEWYNKDGSVDLLCSNETGLELIKGGRRQE